MIAPTLGPLLVSDPPTTPPADFQLRTQSVTTGLPATLTLSDGFQAMLLLPTGLARRWLDADPGALLATSADERLPYDPNAAEALALTPRPPLRLLVRRNGRSLGAVPANVGVIRRISDSGNAVDGVVIEVVLQAWEIYAGSVRGAGNFGSSIQIAWRLADHASDTFGPPVTNQRVLLRRPPAQRIHSIVGLPRDLTLLRARKLMRIVR